MEPGFLDPLEYPGEQMLAQVIFATPPICPGTDARVTFFRVRLGGWGSKGRSPLCKAVLDAAWRASPNTGKGHHLTMSWWLPSRLAINFTPGFFTKGICQAQTWRPN